MLHTIDNNYHFSLLFTVPPSSIFGTTRKTSLHCGHDFTFLNCRLLLDCTLHHILRAPFCSVASTSALIYYYIMNSLHNNIYWSTSSSYICVNIFPPANFDLTSSLRLRFLFLLQITISAKQRTVYAFICCHFFIFTHSFVVFSVMCVHKGFLRMHPGIGSELSDTWEARTQRRHFGCSITTVLAGFMLGFTSIFSFLLFDSFTHFISLCIVHFWAAHSCIRSFIHSHS